MRAAAGVGGVVTPASVPAGGGADTGSGRTGTSRPKAGAPGRRAMPSEEEKVNSWDLNAVDVKPGHPEVLHSIPQGRAIAIDLPAGTALDDHEVHEGAWLMVTR